jgi:hypothetical protein
VKTDGNRTFCSTHRKVVSQKKKTSSEPVEVERVDSSLPRVANTAGPVDAYLPCVANTAGPVDSSLPRVADTADPVGASLPHVSDAEEHKLLLFVIFLSLLFALYLSVPSPSFEMPSLEQATNKKMPAERRRSKVFFFFFFFFFGKELRRIVNF